MNLLFCVYLTFLFAVLNKKTSYFGNRYFYIQKRWLPAWAFLGGQKVERGEAFAPGFQKV